MVVSIGLFVAGLCFQLWTVAFSFSEGTFILKLTAGFSTFLIAMLGLLILISLCHAILHRDSPFESPFSKILGVFARSWFHLDVKFGTIGAFDKYEKLKERYRSGAHSQEQAQHLYGMEYLAQEEYARLIADVADPDLLDRAVLSFLPTSFKDYELSWRKTRFEEPKLTPALFNAIMRMLSVDSSPSVHLTVATQIRAMIKAHAVKHCRLTSNDWIRIRDRLQEVYDDAKRTEAPYRQTFFVTLVDLHTLLQLTSRDRSSSSIIDWSCAEVHLPVDVTIARALKYCLIPYPQCPSSSQTLFCNAVDLCHMLGSTGKTDELLRIADHLTLSEIFRALFAQQLFTWNEFEPSLGLVLRQRKSMLLPEFVTSLEHIMAIGDVNGRMMSFDLIGYFLTFLADEELSALGKSKSISGAQVLLHLATFLSHHFGTPEVNNVGECERNLLKLITCIPIWQFDHWTSLREYVQDIADFPSSNCTPDTQRIATDYLSLLSSESGDPYCIDNKVLTVEPSGTVTEHTIEQCVKFAQDNEADCVRGFLQRQQTGSILCSLIENTHVDWSNLTPLTSYLLENDMMDAGDFLVVNNFFKHAARNNEPDEVKRNIFSFLRDVAVMINDKNDRFPHFHPDLTPLLLRSETNEGHGGTLIESLNPTYLEDIVPLLVFQTAWRLSDQDAVRHIIGHFYSQGESWLYGYLDCLQGELIV